MEKLSPGGFGYEGSALWEDCSAAREPEGQETESGVWLGGDCGCSVETIKALSSPLFSSLPFSSHAMLGFMAIVLIFPRSAS